MKYTFGTPEPVDAVVELGAGSLEIRAEDTEQSEVSVEGDRADEVVVEQTGDSLTVLGPKRGIGFALGRSGQIRVRIVVPTGSGLSAKVGSADIAAEGPLGSVRVRSGSGDIRMTDVQGQAVLTVGSGDIRIENAESHLRVKSGSGDVTVLSAGESVGVVTGSGDIVLDSVAAAASLRSGSGSLTINRAGGDLELSSGSGDISVGWVSDATIRARNASGDISVSVPPGTPVWTDVASVSGRIRSTLTSVGAPGEGQPHVRVTARTASGDVILQNV